MDDGLVEAAPSGPYATAGSEKIEPETRAIARTGASRTPRGDGVTPSGAAQAPARDRNVVLHLTRPF